MTRNWIERIVGVCLCAGALSSCGDGVVGGGNGGGGADSAIVVGNNFFSPANATVTSGTMVTWTWAAGSAPHNVSFTGGPTSATQSSGSYSRTFATVGSFPYLCTIHGSGMSGTVVVQ